jgi:hypothetical protein
MREQAPLLSLTKKGGLGGKKREKKGLGGKKPREKGVGMGIKTGKKRLRGKKREDNGFLEAKNICIINKFQEK